MKQDSPLQFSRKISPCKDCQNRKVGCHARCEEYLAWRASLDSVIAEKDRQAEVSNWTASRIKVTNMWFKSRGDWWKK